MCLPTTEKNVKIIMLWLWLVISKVLSLKGLWFTVYIQPCGLMARLLNQVRTWFLKIDPVRIICMVCVCVRPRGY